MCPGNSVIVLSSVAFRLLLLYNQLSPNLAASNDCFAHNFVSQEFVSC